MDFAKDETKFRSKEGVMFVLFFFALMFTVLGFATPSWTKVLTGVAGLWEIGSLTSYNGFAPNVLIAVKVFMVIALILLGIVVLWLTMYVFGLRLGRNPMNVVIGNAYSTVLCLFLSVVMYGVEYSEGLSYSFAFTIIGMLLTAAGAVVGSSWAYDDHRAKNILIQVQPTPGEVNVQTVQGQVQSNPGHIDVVGRPGP